MFDYMGKRVGIPEYTDAWMSGDRYGTVVRVFTKAERRGEGTPPRAFGGIRHYGRVEMDKSGKTLTFPLGELSWV